MACHITSMILFFNSLEKKKMYSIGVTLIFSFVPLENWEGPPTEMDQGSSPFRLCLCTYVIFTLYLCNYNKYILEMDDF